MKLNLLLVVSAVSTLNIALAEAQLKQEITTHTIKSDSMKLDGEVFDEEYFDGSVNIYSPKIKVGDKTYFLSADSNFNKVCEIYDSDRQIGRAIFPAQAFTGELALIDDKGVLRIVSDLKGLPSSPGINCQYKY